MRRYLLLDIAAHRIDEIYQYSASTWGVELAQHYIRGLFEAFDHIDGGGVLSRPIPAEYGVDGFWFRYKKHFVYWKRLADGRIGIATLLHEKMFQIRRIRDDFVN